MAHILISTSLLLLFTLSATTSGVSASLSAAENLRELETMMETLRPLGYTLFCNAITTSDLQFQILSSNSKSDDFYTIFAAKDPFLYALDMASDAAAYVSTLRYHVSPHRRLTRLDLLHLESPFLPTLLPHYSILVSKSGSNGTVSGNSSASGDVLRVDGVRISDPDLFVGSRIAVHGLDGILVTGIVKNEDLADDERGLGLASAPTAAPVVIPLPEEDVSVLPPSSAPSPPPGLGPATPPPVEVPSQVVVPAPDTPPPSSPPVAVPSPMVTPVPVVAPDTPPPPPPVAFPSPFVLPAPLVAPDQGVVPPGEDETDGGKGLKEKHSEKHKPKPKKTDGGKGVKEARRAKHQPPPEKETDGGKGLKETRRGAKHQALKEKETDGGKGMKDSRQGAKHQPLWEKESDGGKGWKEGRRAKHHRVTHQNHHHQVKHNNRHHQNRRNRVHRKDDL